jgi:endonuclease/exonuclease/phosphatase family metal-dependent hydrolase
VLRTGTAWLLVVPLAAWLVVRATGVGAGTWIETALVATPFAAAGSVAILALVAALRVWPAIAAAGVVCVGFGVVIAPLFVPGPHPTPAPTGPGLTVMTVNVQFGRADPQRVVDLVEEGDVAVLGVQELTPAFDEALRAAGLDDLLPYGVVHARPGASGTGLYSRFRVREVDREIAGRHANPTGLVTVPGAAPFQVTVVHPVPPVGDTARTAWRQTFGTLPRPDDPPADGTERDDENDEPTHLLIGDFNATVDQPTMRALLDDGYVDAAGAVGRGWAVTWRFPRTPPLAIDHVLVDRRTRVRSVDVHRVAGSDHRAVVADLQLPAA